MALTIPLTATNQGGDGASDYSVPSSVGYMVRARIDGRRPRRRARRCYGGGAAGQFPMPRVRVSVFGYVGCV